MAAALVSFTGCAKRMSDEERLARGRELIQQMSNKLASSNTLSFSTQEHKDIVARNGQKTTVQRAREVLLRRPDRLYTKQTGDRPVESWYDGKYVTLAMHSEKVYGQVRSPDTVDATLDALSKRFGIVMPVGDLLYSKPETLLLTHDIKGGYAGTQQVGGTDCHHLRFTMPGVDWELWLPTQGDPLPRRIKTIDKGHKGAPVTDITFSNWNLAATSTDDAFKPKVPGDYEGIAVLQRAAALPKGESGSETGTRSRSDPGSKRK